MSIVGVDWGGGGSSAPVPCDRFVGWFLRCVTYGPTTFSIEQLQNNIS